MEPNSHPLYSFAACSRAVWRYRYRAATVFALTLVATCAALAVMPRTYVSEAQLFVRVGRESVTLDPTASTGQTISVHESRESEINSVLDMLGSQAVLEQMIALRGANAILAQAKAPYDREAGAGRAISAKAAGSDSARPSAPATDVPPESMPLQPVAAHLNPADETANAAAPTEGMFDAARERLAAWGLSDPVGADQQAIELLKKSIYVESSRRSNVITVGCKAGSPDAARELLELFLSVYEAQHLRANRTAGSLDFFERERARAEQVLAEATRAVRDARNEVGVLSIDSQRAIIQEALGQLNAQSHQAQSSVAGSTEKIAALERQLAALPAHIETERTAGLPNEAADAMRARLYELQIRERELSARLNDNHPEMEALRRQVAESQNLLNEQAAERTQTRTALNPAHQQVEQFLLAERAALVHAAAQRDELERQLAGLHAQLAAMNEQEVHLTECERARELAEATFRRYHESWELARIDHELQAQSISNVNVVQAPTWNEKPVRPQKRAIFAAGLCAALLGGVGAAVVSDARRKA